jgi:hypothetical protein
MKDTWVCAAFEGEFILPRDHLDIIVAICLPYGELATGRGLILEEETCDLLRRWKLEWATADSSEV